MKIKIIANDKGNPPGKLADAEIHFEEADGILSGCKLIGFGVWERRTGRGEINITFPARQYTINSERRSFALLRPITDTTDTLRIRDRIVEAWKEYAAQTYKITDRAHPDYQENEAKAAAAWHRNNDPHCTCTECVEHHARQLAGNSTDTTTKETDPILF